MSVSSSTVSGLFAGRYFIERRLGEGATATVHLARDTQAGVAVAIKLLRPELVESGAASRFSKEVRQTVELTHPRILPILASGDHDGQPYIVLPYMEGGSLRERLLREKQLPIDEAIAIVAPIADALDFAHSRGLIHRDVKPENILFTAGEPVLSDFGIARALERVLDETTTSTGIVRGTPAYLSPEQASASKDLDGRSDQYALACVLYEMLAGVPAFIGPTPESIIAQRFTHLPREIRAYRNTVSPELDRAILKALNLSPADRYRSAAEFMATVRGAARGERPAGPPQGASRYWARWIVAAAGVAAIAVAVPLVRRSGEPGPGPVVLDTTRVVVLPFDEPANAEPAGADLLVEGLRRYRGLSVVEAFATADAVRQRGSVRSLDDAFAVARGLGAGRVVRGRLMRAGNEDAAYAALYDVSSRAELYNARVTVPSAPSAALQAYVSLADSLILRGAEDPAPGVGALGSINLPAVQAMIRARSALAEWDLPAAESLYLKAVEIEPGLSRGHLWLSQVRSWMGQGRSRWETSARLAAADSTRLVFAEREQAAGLLALAVQDYPAACAVYARMTAARPNDFLAWYGLGECQKWDRIVVPDSRSPTNWSFRSSYYRAMLAYKRAFEVLPTSYRQFQRSAYEPLQLLLYTTGTALRQGHTADSSRFFLSRPTGVGDTIAFIPYPREATLSGELPGNLERARVLTRRMFRDVALRWAAALPGSAGTKEAVAVSLEMLGDMAAARDSFRVARRLARDPSQRLRLAIAEVLTDIKAAVRAPGRDLSQSLALADSLLRSVTPGDAVEAEGLARLAVLAGRCGTTASLMRRAVQPFGTPVPVPPTLTADLHAILPRVVLGCDEPVAIPRVAETLREVGGGEPDRLMSEYQTIGLVIAMFPGEHSERVRQLAVATGDYVLAAEDSLIQGDTAAVRRVLTRQNDRRASAGATALPPDAGFTEARVWLSIGDTVMAITQLERTLDAFGTDQPLFARSPVQNAIRLAAFTRALAMRAELAASRDGSGARWAGFLVSLWNKADPELHPVRSRMQSLSRR